jgi:polysaccharide export outer membrane protein
MAMIRKISLTFIACSLLLSVCGFPNALAQGREYLRTRAGSLAAEETVVSGKEAPLVKYFLAPDDVLEIFVWQNPDLTKDVTVDSDGEISHPLTGRIKVAGLTVAELEDKIKEELNKQVKFVSAGDVLEIFVWQNPDLNRDVTVDAGGQISHPFTGRIQAAGLTIAQLEEIIREKFSEYIKSPRVSVTRKKFTGRVSVIRKKFTGEVSVNMKKFGGNKIIVLGEINYPGIYTYKGAINLIEAIALAGDFTEDAHKDSVMVVRGNLSKKPEVKQINMVKMITGGATNTDIILKPNDVIFIPRTFIANLNKFISDIGPVIAQANNALVLRKEIRRLQKRDR